MQSVLIDKQIDWAGKPPPIEDEKLPLVLSALVIIFLSSALWAVIAALVIWAI